MLGPGYVLFGLIFEVWVNAIHCCVNPNTSDLVMKMVRIFFILFVGMLLFIGCKQTDVVIITSFPIEKSLEYSAFYTHDIIDPYTVAVSDKYLFLAGINSELIFQQYELPELKYTRSFGVRGRGPGEFVVSPLIYISRNKEKLYMNHAERKQFGAYLILNNGELLLDNEFSTKYGFLYNHFNIINDSLLIYNTIPSKIGIEIIDLLTDKTPSEIEFTKNNHYTGDSYCHPDNGTLSVNDRYIVYAYSFRKQIDIYDIKNLELKVRLLSKGQKEKITTSVQSKRYYNDVYVTENFIYACYVDRDIDDEQNKYFIEVYDFMGTPKKRFNMGVHVGNGLFAVTPDDRTIYSYSYTLDKILKFDITDF